MSLRLNGDLLAVREIEDNIRVTKKYTEEMLTEKRERPMQGCDEPTRKFTKCYTVYTTANDRGIIPLLDWLRDEMPNVHVRFWYDYPNGAAWVSVEDRDALKELSKAIPRLTPLLDKLRELQN